MFAGLCRASGAPVCPGMKHAKRILLSIFMSNLYIRNVAQTRLGVVAVFLFASPGMAAQIEFPLYGHVYFETNGPYTPLDNGDWWTHVDYGNRSHEYQMVIPETVNPSG